MVMIYGSVRFIEIILVVFDQKTTKLVQNLCPLYRECLLYGILS